METSWQQLVLATVANRACTEIVTHRRCLVYGPPGFGKTRVHDRLRQEHAAERLDTMDERFDPELLWQLIWTTPDGAECLVGASRPPLHSPETVLIGPDTLAIEPADLPPDAPLHVAGMLAKSGGWPDLIATALDGQSQNGPVSPATLRLREELVFRCIRDSPDALLDAFAVLSRFRRFTPEMLAALDPTLTIAGAQQAGLPIIEASDGWLTVLEPVRSALHGRFANLAPQAATALQGPMLVSLGPIAAVEAFVDAGSEDAAASLIATLDRRQLAGADTTRLIALLNVLVQSQPTIGRLSLMLGNAHGALAQFAEQRTHLDAARLAARSAGDEALRAEVDAEALLLDQTSLPLEDVVDRLAELQERSAGVATRTTSTRLKEIEALLLGRSPVLADVHDAANRLELIANQWEFAGERDRAGRTIRTLCAGCLTYLGEYAKAAVLLERALALGLGEPGQLQRTNRLYMFMSARLADNETFAERREAEMVLLSSVEPVAWLEAYRSWAEMIHASFNSSAERVRQTHMEAMSRLGQLRDAPTGAYLLTEAAMCAALVGDESLARESLVAVRAHISPHPLELFLAEVAVESTFGTPETLAEVIADNADLEVPAARAWRIDLARYVQATRLGLETTTNVESIMADAGRFGLGQLAQRLFEIHDVGLEAPATRVQLLGPLRVFVAGEEVALPPGKVTELLKLLAVRDRQLPVEVVVDHLWPDADLDRGRARLRNCINRLRNLLGPDTLVRSADSLSLSADVVIDLREFWAGVNDLSAHPSAALRVANLYHGNLLEADLYADWLHAEREATRHAMERALDTGLNVGVISDEQATTVRNCLDRLD